jgi:hypothetical protein
MTGFMPTEHERDWQSTGEKRWRVIKRAGGYRTVRSEAEEVDMNSGESRWIPIAHATVPQKAPAGWRQVPKYERVEKDDGSAGEVLPWGYKTKPTEST